MLKQKSIQTSNLPGATQAEISEKLQLETMQADETGGSPVAMKATMERIPLLFTVELGRAIITLRDLRNIRQGQVLTLDQVVGEPLGVFANGQRLGSGEVVAAGKDQYGIRITTLVEAALKPDENTP